MNFIRRLNRESFHLLNWYFQIWLFTNDVNVANKCSVSPKLCLSGPYKTPKYQNVLYLSVIFFGGDMFKILDHYRIYYKL